MSWATGKYAIAICDRCGFKYPHLEMRFEPGTQLRVCDTCNDGSFSLVSHPQNYPPARLSESIAIRHARPDVVLATTGDASWDPSDSTPNQKGGQT